MILSVELTLSVDSTLSVELGSSRELVHHHMDSTKPRLTTAKISRGMSARACVARTMMWKLDSAKGVLAHDASISKASLPQVTWKIQEDHQTSENHKRMLE